MQSLFDAALLVLEDQPELLRLLRRSLSEAGYRRIACCQTAAQARVAFARSRPDFMILDINLPDGDGFSLFQELHAQADIPALFLSARDADSDRLFGLGLGADDYMTKPFLMQELLLRVQLILRRTYRAKTEDVFLLGDRVIHLGDATVSSPSGLRSLTATERALLRKLFENRGHVVTYDALCEYVWGDGAYGYENSLNVHIRHLREKLEDDPSHPRYLLTARGVGYRLLTEERA